NGAYVVNNFQTGEWLQYTIQVAQTGTYRLDLLVSRRWDLTSRWHAEIDNQPVTGSVVVPDTGSWDAFWWVGVGGITLTAGAYVVNNFQTGEWLQYTIQVAQAGTYRLELLVSRRWDVPSRVHVEVDTQPVTGSVVVPDTGSWDVFWWVGLGSISLTAGTHVL